MIDLLGVTIHDPDVVFTDAGLAILGAWLGWKLWNARGGDTVPRAGVVVMGGLASAALWGAIFHAFFPAGTATRPGFIVWIPVWASILVVAAALLWLSLRLLTPRLSVPVHRALVLLYVLSFGAVAAVVDASFEAIVRFYAPVLLLFLVASTRQAVRLRDAGWTLVAVSFAISGVAAAAQQARLGIHPDYFDHNAVYHVLQGAALVLLYFGFRRVPA